MTRNTVNTATHNGAPQRPHLPTPGRGLIFSPAAPTSARPPPAEQSTKPPKYPATKDLTGPAPSWMTWNLTGDNPAELSLTWSIDEHARAALEDEIFGKRILVTNHDDWPIADVVAAYRSQSDAEFGFRQLKDPHTVSFSPMNHFTDQAIRGAMLETCG